MKKIAPLFFIIAVLLSVWICVQIYSHRLAPMSPSGPPLIVSATKGPLKLSLTLYSDRVPRGGPLWFRLTVTNVGKKPFTFDYPAFATKFTYDGKNFIDYLSDPFKSKDGLHLVVLDDKGKEVDQKYESWPVFGDADPCLGFPPESFQFESYPKAQQREFIRTTKAWWAAVDASKATFRHLVSPGSSIETIAWSYHGYCEGERRNPPVPPGRFAEFYGLDLSRPGHYRIFAGLNHVPTKKELKKELEEEKREDQGALRADRRMGFKSDWYWQEKQKELEQQEEIDRGSLRVDRMMGRKSDWYWHQEKPIPRAEDAVIQTPSIDFEALP